MGTIGGFICRCRKANSIVQLELRINKRLVREIFSITFIDNITLLVGCLINSNISGLSLTLL